jgi:hypothetical protein
VIGRPAAAWPDDAVVQRNGSAGGGVIAPTGVGDGLSDVALPNVADADAAAACWPDAEQPTIVRAATRPSPAMIRDRFE